MLTIPDECVPYIRLQRSRFLKVDDKDEVKRLYAEWVARDFAGMEPHLPPRVDSILEIGCGMAAIEVHLKRKYPQAYLSLLDGDGEVAVGGYRKTSEPYNSRAMTELLLSANAVKVDRWIDISTREHLKADLILSLSSLGFHYPFTTYHLEGFVICDLRRGSEAQRGALIMNERKYYRCAFRMP